MVSHLCLLSLPRNRGKATEKWIKKTRTERQVREKRDGGVGTKKVAEKFKRKSSPLVKY